MSCVLRNSTTPILITNLEHFFFFIFDSIIACMTDSSPALRPGIPPIQPAPDILTLPLHEQFFLSNGTKVLFFEDRSQPVVSISNVFRRGGMSAQMLNVPAGVQSFTASMLTKGTAQPAPTRTAQDIAMAMDYMGGTLSASSGWDSSSMNITVLAQYVEESLQLAADSLFAPAMTTDEVERLRAQSLVGIQHNLEDPGYLATSALARGLYAGHPYSSSLYGTLDSMSAIQADDCHAYHRNVFTLNDSFIACAGNLTAEQAIKLLDQTFGRQIDPPSQYTEPAVPSIAESSVYAIQKQSAVQTALRIALPAPHRQDADFIPMRVLNAIIGGMFTSRLNSKLREEKGYTYGIHSSVDPRRLASTLVIGTSVGNDVTAPAIRDILAEMERLAHEPVHADELALAKNYMLGAFALATETPNQIISLASGREIYGLHETYYQEYFRRISAMTIEELFAVQQRWIVPDKLIFGVSGDMGVIREAFHGLLTVHELSAE